MAHHLAAVLEKAGEPLALLQRPTPTPGPGDIVVAVSAVALNPVDAFQRDHGFFVTTFPAVLGSDISGTVAAVGADVTNVKVGDRVLGHGMQFVHGGQAEYGAHQERVLIPATSVALLPASVTFPEAASLPMAVSTAWSGYRCIDVPFDAQFKPSDRKGLLVHGAASNVGTAAVQIAHQMGYTVYATASPQHHAMLTKLGAAKVFDYKSEGVVNAIVDAAKRDGLTIATCYLAAGTPEIPLDVVAALRGSEPGKIAHAPPLPKDGPSREGIDMPFVQPPPSEDERARYYQQVFNTWLQDTLAKGAWTFSPPITLVKEGLHGANDALTKLKGGVSGTKLVLDLS